MIEAGGNRSTESFDYGTGDMWLYGANEAHMVQGHEDGCTYLAGARPYKRQHCRFLIAFHTAPVPAVHGPWKRQARRSTSHCHWPVTT